MSRTKHAVSTAICTFAAAVRAHVPPFEPRNRGLGKLTATGRVFPYYRKGGGETTR